MNFKLISYIKLNRRSGKTDEEIKQSLLGAGWKEEDVETGFSFAGRSKFILYTMLLFTWFIRIFSVGLASLVFFAIINGSGSSPESNFGTGLLMLGIFFLSIIFIIFAIFYIVMLKHGRPFTQIIRQLDKVTKICLILGVVPTVFIFLSFLMGI